MVDVKPRTSRREKAAATRERMIEAAITEFTSSGYVGARMTDIAKRADVAVQTVHFTFHTKSELLQACYQHAVYGPEKVPPPQQSFWNDIRRARSGRGFLEAFVRGNLTILRRVAPIDQVARTTLHEPEVVEVVAFNERLRRDGYANIVNVLAERFGMRRGLSREEATDLLLVLCGGPTYLTFAEYGWDDAAYIAWVTKTLAADLLKSD